MAFCSEMPLICSSTLRGLWVCISRFLELFVESRRRRGGHERGGRGGSIRVCHGFDGIEATVDNELDVSS